MSDDHLRAAGFDFSPQPTAVIDLHRGDILGCNRAFSVLLGLSEEELVHRPLEAIVPRAKHAQLREALEATRTSPLLGHDARLVLQREDGTDVNVGLQCRLVDAGPEREAPRAVLAVNELSETPDPHAAFVTLLAHEVRNQLSNIRLAAQILEGETAPEGSRWPWGLSVMNRQVVELSHLLDDLLAVSGGDQAIDLQPVDLHRIVQYAVDNMPLALDAADVWLELSTEPVYVWADERRLVRAVERLVRTATHHDGEAVAVRVECEGEQVILTVEGLGLQPERFPVDFDLVKAAARPDLNPFLAAGLLAGIPAELHNEPGSTRVRLPAAPEPAPTVSRESARSQPFTGTQRETSPPGGDPRVDNLGQRILVVDDDPGAANTLALLLSTGGHSVEVAHDAEHGLAAAERHQPQVALLDLKMPGMDGYTLGRRLRDRLGAGLKLIALTGLDDPADRARVLDAGFDHHVVKPVDIEDLTALLETSND